MKKEINDKQFWDSIRKNTNKVVNENWKSNSGKKHVKRTTKKK